MKYNEETGEILSQETYDLVTKEVNAIEIMDKWLDAREALLTAKEQFEMVDVPFKKKLKEIFAKYSITRFYNEYIDVQNRKGYVRKSFDTEMVEQYIREHGDDPERFKKGKYIPGTLAVKYKDE